MLTAKCGRCGIYFSVASPVQDAWWVNYWKAQGIDTTSLPGGTTPGCPDCGESLNRCRTETFETALLNELRKIRQRAEHVERQLVDQDWW